VIQSYQYGAGEVIVKDSAGNSHIIGLLQNNSFDLSSTNKGIKGSGLYDEVVAVMGQDVSIKASGAICSSGLEAIASGGTIATGVKLFQTDVKTPSSNTATVTAPNSGTYSVDLGVVRVQTGQPLSYNSGTLATGQYQNTAGAYTFYAADFNGTTDTCRISYLYTLTSGETLTVTNKAVGLLTSVGVRVFNVSTDSANVVRKIGRYVPSAAITKFSVSNKVGDFMSVDLEFKAFATMNSTVYEAYYA
jgi:hypothetical protein